MWLSNRSRRRCALLVVLLTAGCGITRPESCTPARFNTVSRVFVRDSAGMELARGHVAIQSTDGDTVPAWFVLSVDAETGSAPLMGHVTSAVIVDASRGLVFEPQLERRPYYTAQSRIPLHDPAQATDLRARLEHDTLTLVMTTDLKGLGTLRVPLVFDPISSGTVAAYCFPPCRRFQYCD